MSSNVSVQRFVPYFRPHVGDEEAEEVVKVLKSGWLCMGPKVVEFEDAFKSYVGARHAVAVSSCTAALHLSLIARGVGRGDEVITTPYTFASTANVIEHVGATPVFVDVQKDTFNIDPDAIRRSVTPRTKAILPVHFAGQACDLDEVNAIAAEHGVSVIEDAAHAIGTRYHGNRIGGGPCANFSFYVNKNMTSAEGGMVTTDDAAFAERLSVLRLQGMSRDAWKRYAAKNTWRYDVTEPGWKYNLTDLQAAIGLAQLKKIDWLNQRRKQIVARYTEAFKDLDRLVVPQEKNAGHAWHLYALRVHGISRDAFIERLSELGVGTGVHFIPIHHFTYYAQKYGFPKDAFPVADALFQGEVSLPLYPGLSDPDVEHVISAVKSAAHG